MAKEENWRLFLYAYYCTGSLSLLIRVKVSSVLIMYRVSIFYLCPKMFNCYHIKDIELHVTINMYHTKGL